MVHGPCEEANFTLPCMKNDICSKKYSRRFVTGTTQTDEDNILGKSFVYSTPNFDRVEFYLVIRI